MMSDRLKTARSAYLARFPDAALPEPFEVNDEALARVLERAVADGQPVPPDFDWWADLPPDAVA